MPRPVPPPPPQPSVEETVQAVSYLRKVVAVGVLFFLAWSGFAYGPDSFIQPWGRDSSQSWMVHKARSIDEQQLRAHEGGKVVWLVGSSILRESMDVESINAELSDRHSPFRVEMFCQGRGAAGLASGMVQQLPLKPGDLVIHNVAVQNIRKGWLAWTGLPAARLSRMLSPAQLWETREWSVPERLEQLVAVPWNFWRWHDDTQDGLTRWLVALAEGRTPRKRRPGVYYKFTKMERASVFAAGLPDWEVDRNLLTADSIDYSPTQFNMQGLERLRDYTREHDIELVLLNIPPSAFAQWKLETEQVREDWAAWTTAQPEMVFAPQLPDTHFYDRRHPNFRGREELSGWFADWLTGDRPRGSATIPPQDTVIDYPWSTPKGSRDNDSSDVEGG